MSETLPQLKEQMTLRELTEFAGQIMASLAESGGELTPEIESLLGNLDLKVGKKIDGYKFLMSKMEAEEKFWRSEADTRTKIARSCAAFNDRLYDAIKDAMVKLGVKEVQGETFRAVLSPTKGRLVVDEAKLPEQYKTQVVSLVVDKEKVRKDLEAFVEVPGATLEGGTGLKFYNAKKG